MTDLKLFYIKPDSTMPEEHQRKMWGVALNWTSTSKTFHGLGTKKDSEPSIENIIEAANEVLQAASEYLKHDVPFTVRVTWAINNKCRAIIRFVKACLRQIKVVFHDL